MRGFVEALEAVEQGLPDGVEPTIEQIMTQLKAMTLGNQVSVAHAKIKEKIG